MSHLLRVILWIAREIQNRVVPLTMQNNSEQHILTRETKPYAFKESKALSFLNLALWVFVGVWI